jgi:hypothetical protein
MSEEIIIVTGLPRSGTSLMMQVLNNAGLTILHDGKREKDESNPEGYFELEAVKGIVADNSFLKDAPGKVVKVVCPLPIYLDTRYSYRVVFMRRDLEEILRSQEKMLNKNQVSEREKYRTIYEFHLKKTYRFLQENGIPFIDIKYIELVADPVPSVEKLIAFLDRDLDKEMMLSAVKPELYRNRNEQEAK